MAALLAMTSPLQFLLVPYSGDHDSCDLRGYLLSQLWSFVAKSGGAAIAFLTSLTIKVGTD